MNYYSLLKFEIWGKQNGDELDELCHEPRESSSGENVCSCWSKSSKSSEHNGIGTNTYNGQVLQNPKIILSFWSYIVIYSIFNLTHMICYHYIWIFSGKAVCFSTVQSRLQIKVEQEAWKGMVKLCRPLKSQCIHQNILLKA